jgi:hypothetical protein
VTFSLQKDVDLAVLLQAETFKDELPRFLEFQQIICEDVVLIELLDDFLKTDAVDPPCNVVDSLHLTFGLLKSQIIRSLVFLYFLLLLLEFSLMVLLFNRIALPVVSVATPYFETNPTKMVTTSARHVNAASIFVYVGLTHRTLLGHYLIKPLLIFVVHDLVPRLQISTVERKVIALSTNSANFVTTCARQCCFLAVVDENCFVTTFPSTNPHFFTSLGEL